MIQKEKKLRVGFDVRMTKEEINEFPLVSYNGTVHIVRSLQDMKSAVKELRGETLLGFDTETKPSFKKGEEYPASIIQLAGKNIVYIFQLAHFKFPGALESILSNPDIIKTGVALDDDIKKIRDRGFFDPAGFLDLGSVAKRAGMKNQGLRGLAAVLLGVRISKGAQVSNWAQDKLSPTQIRYAATDAWIGREIYMHLKKTGEIKSGNNQGVSSIISQYSAI